jgi:integrase
MSRAGTKTTTSGMEWNAALGLTHRLKQDGNLTFYLFILCGCYFGLRAGDLLSLAWPDVLDRDDFTIHELCGMPFMKSAACLPAEEGSIQTDTSSLTDGAALYRSVMSTSNFTSYSPSTMSGYRTLRHIPCGKHLAAECGKWTARANVL